MRPVLEVRGVHKSFASVVAADDVNVSVRRGERVGVIGTNGAGKTTFVNMVTGYTKPDAGTILLEGEDITAKTPRLITLHGVCRSFQTPQLFLTLTAEENLLAALSITGGKSDAELATALERLLDRFQVREYRYRVVSELPGGVRKLVDIAVAVTRGPKLLLLDEPTSGVAAEQKFALMDIVMGAIEDRITVLFVEHDMDIVGHYADRVLAFHEGRIIADDKPAVVLASSLVKRRITGAAS